MRSDMRWLLLLTAIIGIVGSAHALKATSLIFGRAPNANKTTTTTTTTTSTTVATVGADPLIDEEKKDDGESLDEDAVTKPPLTGIPQIDYIWDPNLPRELNGFNLSTYPFLNSVPDADDIDFKCDGLHDGFYASIKYSCQLYHHCVYGIRHDFLCANFTAFDQKSFICHFVSEVNCKSSAKYWFRNDALYQAMTTTSTTTTTIAPPPTTSHAPDRPLRRPDSRRPLRRRRPQQHEYFYDDEDYDDDYVEERMNRRRKTNRNRNRRPEYDDEYDNPPPRTNYKEDDDYSEFERPAYRHDRNRNRNRDGDDDFEYDRRSHRNRKRPTENKRHHDDDDEEVERMPASDARKPVESGKRKKNDRRTSLTDDKTSVDDRRSLGEDDRFDRRKVNDDRRPMDDDRRSTADEARRQNHDKRRPTTPDARRPQYEDEYEDYAIEKTKKHSSRDDDYDDRAFGKRPKPSQPEIVPKVRSGGTASIFNRPRAPPKINRPVPNNEKKKYEYTPQKTEKATTAAAAPETEEEIYDEYDYEGQPVGKHDSIESKKTYPASSSQRDQRPPSRVELKQDKLPPSSFNTDEIEDEDFDIKEKVTSIKPQRSTSPKIEPIQHRPAKTEFYEKPKEAAIKPNARPALEFNKDEYIPDPDTADYADEETDDQLTKDEEVHQPETIPTRTDFRSSAPVQEHQIKVPESLPIPKHEEMIPKIPYAAQPPSPPLVSQQDLLHYKTKFHRLGPVSNVRTAEDIYQKPVNTEPEERDVYTILSKDIVPTIREPSGFKPVSYNDPAHDLELESPKNRPYVRIMKRPFLPSRGGSPYLPRGLKPVGSGITTAEFTTESFHANSKLSSNIGNGQLFGHNLPIPRTNPNNAYGQPQTLHQLPLALPPQPQPHSHPHPAMDLRTTTQQPQIESPRSPLDEIFNSDYDVTLNDALNPTLKPLSHSHENPIGFSKYDRAYARSDVSHSPSQYRTTAIPIPIQSRHAPQMAAQQQPQPHHAQQQQSQQRQQTQQSQQQSQYYDDEYDY